ncbi:hypothetical protein [Mycobacterium sp. ACS4331]|uniref:hypothetical protein n=1 Tax=Mycobacterium sp. ACS4331 TaxID=1834121 RepID=UPI0007FE55C7|nr:hypothetical protein [Mycobacterium sp. ACS4331]OBF25693.1 hypothetical protein A5727_03995 [Mycobacterium sp. ACS4331]
MTQPPSTPHEPPSGEQTRIIRRAPTGDTGAVPRADDAHTSIIRRAPTQDSGAQAQADNAHTSVIGPAPTGSFSTQHIPTPKVGAPKEPSPVTAVAACVVAMLSGWATSVVATSLIIGWWDTDRLFCVAVAFLAFVFASSTITGIVMVLLRRIMGRWLVAAGAVVALLAFVGVFIAGAKIPWIVYAIPVLPVVSAALALHPATKRWILVS